MNSLINQLSVVQVLPKRTNDVAPAPAAVEMSALTRRNMSFLTAYIQLTLRGRRLLTCTPIRKDTRRGLLWPHGSRRTSFSIETGPALPRFWSLGLKYCEFHNRNLIVTTLDTVTVCQILLQVVIIRSANARDSCLTSTLKFTYKFVSKWAVDGKWSANLSCTCWMYF